ncbi:hypothetical protein TNCV_1623151, partial [Trichonephila clavipes]
FIYTSRARGFFFKGLVVSKRELIAQRFPKMLKEKRTCFLASFYKAIRRFLGTDLVIFNPGQETRTTAELPYPPNFHNIQREGFKPQ